MKNKKYEYIEELVKKYNLKDAKQLHDIITREEYNKLIKLQVSEVKEYNELVKSQLNAVREADR